MLEVCGRSTSVWKNSLRPLSGGSYPFRPERWEPQTSLQWEAEHSSLQWEAEHSNLQWEAEHSSLQWKAEHSSLQWKAEHSSLQWETAE